MPQKYSKPVYELQLPWWVYDTAITAGLLAFSVLALRIHWLFWLVVAILFYGSFIEPRRLTVKRFVIGEKTGEKTLRIVFLSDIHAGPYKKTGWIRKLVKKTNALKPDVVLLGGDYLYDNASDARYLEPFSELRASLGVCAIFGNHDTYYGKGEVKDELERAGITVFENASHHFEKDGRGFSVIGVNDDWYDETEFGAAMEGVPKGDAKIMMIHNPDLAPHAAKLKSTVMLSGHTHGGQIRLPFIGTVPRLPHYLGRKYDRGRFDFEGVPLILGQGVGESGPRARLLCPPQIVMVEIRL